ncbi:DNA-directed RNA polymerase subunit alpha [bacterium]|nr:DNA-directed RNA polymerase subunit alpha [bacterium]
MQNWAGLQMPERIELDESTYTTTYGKFIVQPLERGFGVTIGNSLRRVLLSSLPGAAITSIKVDGVLHEFSTIPGVAEDVSEIVLNLKSVRFKLHNKKPDKIVVHLKGPGAFTAADVQKASNGVDFEVLNPELHIATLSKEANFQIELRIGRGKGWVPSEENKFPDMPIGTIPIDSIFNPIKNVRYTIESTRVGQHTDFEKLIIEITTDGSITPDDALTISARLLRDHIQLFINFEIEEESQESELEDKEISRIRQMLKMSVDELELSVRSHNCLRAAGIKTIGDLVSKNESEMLKYRNFGRKSLTELNKILEERGMHFGMDVSKYYNGEE